MIQKNGDVPLDDMRRSFNLGIGMVLIVSPDGFEQLETHLKSINEEYTLIGKVI